MTLTLGVIIKHADVTYL